MLTWTITTSTEHFDGRVYFHRDYFDLSAMFYERLPVIGGVMGWLKKRAGEALSHQG